MSRAGRPVLGAGLPVRWQQGGLALLLVFAQLLAAVHALGHFAGLLPAPQLSAPVLRAEAPPGERDEAPGVHSPCLVCIATAGLSAALPSTSAVLPVSPVTVFHFVQAPPRPLTQNSNCPLCRGPPPFLS